jgi:hypothetical protein
MSEGLRQIGEARQDEKEWGKKLRPDAVALYLKKQAEEPTSLVLRLCEETLEKPRDLDRFRRALMRKLDGLAYPFPPDPEGLQRSFLSILRSKKGVGLLLCASALKELGSCLLIREVARGYAEFTKAKRSETGYPVDFHVDMLRALERHLERIRGSMRKSKVPEDWASGYFDALWAQVGKDARAVISYKKRDSLNELLHPHRSADVATELAIYSVLARRLKGKNLRDRFLQQLAMLISGSLEEKSAKGFGRVEESFRRAIARQRKVDKTPKK